MSIEYCEDLRDAGMPSGTVCAHELRQLVRQKDGPVGRTSPSSSSIWASGTIFKAYSPLLLGWANSAPHSL